MKHVKLYNVIFPIWFALFLPPMIFITLFGNFLIDSVVILVCFFIFRLAVQQIELKPFYKNTIVKVWLFGFVADIIGAGILFIIGMIGDIPGLPYEVTSAINYDPFSHPAALSIVILALLISGIFIFFFNYKFTFAKQVEDKRLRLKIALTLSIVTMPWTFLLPTRWFYRGF